MKTLDLTRNSRQKKYRDNQRSENKKEVRLYLELDQILLLKKILIEAFKSSKDTKNYEKQEAIRSLITSFWPFYLRGKNYPIKEVADLYKVLNPEKNTLDVFEYYAILAKEDLLKDLKRASFLFGPGPDRNFQLLMNLSPEQQDKVLQWGLLYYVLNY